MGLCKRGNASGIVQAGLCKRDCASGIVQAGLSKRDCASGIVQSTCATTGDGLYEALDWLQGTLDRKQARHGGPEKTITGSVAAITGGLTLLATTATDAAHGLANAYKAAPSSASATGGGAEPMTACAPQQLLAISDANTLGTTEDKVRAPVKSAMGLGTATSAPGLGPGAARAIR